MKKIKYIIVALTALAVSTGCNYLDLEPETTLTEDNFYKTPSDFYSALIAAYSSLVDDGIYGSSMYLFGDARSDVATPIQPNFYANNFRREIETFTMSSINSANQNYWSHHYRGIIRANIIITRGSELFPDDKLVQQYVAEAKVLRALFYFNLVRAYGGVPIVLDVPAGYTDARTHVRASAESVYIRIITDLKEAIAAGCLYRSATNSKVPTGRVDVYVAKALLGKVFVSLPDETTAAAYPDVPAWRDLGNSPQMLLMYPAGAATKWEAAKYSLDDVVSNGGYDLFPSFSGLFKPENKHSCESLWEAEYLGSQTEDVGSNFYTNFCPNAYAPRNYPNANGYTPAAIAANTGGGNCMPTGFFMEFAQKWDSMYPNYTYQVRLFDGQVYSDRRISDGATRVSGTSILPANPNRDYPQSTAYPYDPYTGTTYTITVKGFGDDTKWMCGKYMSPSEFKNKDSDDNWYILRYADVLLLLAEAEAHIHAGMLPQEILDATINRVRVRAGIIPYSISGNAGDDWVLSTPDKTYQAIMDERMLELAFEGHRWFDLTRSGQAVTVMNKHFTDFYNAYTSNSATTVNQYYMKDHRYEIDQYCTLFPIPTQEILTNVQLEQNYRAR